MSEIREKALTVPSSDKNRGGRPEAEINYDLLSQLAQIGMTQEESCPLLKISPATFSRRMKEEERFRTVWEEGRANFKQSLRLLQIKQAKRIGPSGVAMTIHMSKHQLGETEKSVIEHANKDGKAFVVAAAPTEVMGVDLKSASPEVLAALEVIAAAAEKAAADAARDITDTVTED